MIYTHNMCDFPSFDHAVKFLTHVHIAAVVQDAAEGSNNIEIEIIPPHGASSELSLILRLLRPGVRAGHMNTLNFRRFRSDRDAIFSWQSGRPSTHLHGVAFLMDRAPRVWFVEWLTAFVDCSPRELLGGPYDELGWDWDGMCPRDMPGTQSLLEAVREKLAYSSAYRDVLRARKQAREEGEQGQHGYSPDQE